MKLTDFDYNLPSEFIAQDPIEPRDHSKLMLLNKTTVTIKHRVFKDIADLLEPGDVLVLNNTKVIPARLYGTKKDTGAKIEVFLLRRIEPGQYSVMLKPGKRVQEGTEIEFTEQLQAEVIQIDTDKGLYTLQFNQKGAEFRETLEKIGETPTPPYIAHKQQHKDKYQTVYAKFEGSVAAPTAGFHFTEELMAELREKGVQIEYVTLHVGLGTFQPVKTDNILEHDMHEEIFELEAEVAERLNQAKSDGRRIVAVGTTSIRTLEHCAKLQQGVMTPCLEAGSGSTNLFIYPGYQFKFIDAIITNFHLPKSTLLMLVSAFAGREFTLKAYEEAKENDYRFYSFGDAMLIMN